MSKIWIKSPDSNKQCCACENMASGPCASCCKGIEQNAKTLALNVDLYAGSVFGDYADLPFINFLGPKQPSGTNCYVVDSKTDDYTSSKNNISFNINSENMLRTNGFAINLTKGQELDINFSTTFSAKNMSAIFKTIATTGGESAKFIYEPYSGNYLLIQAITTAKSDQPWAEILSTNIPTKSAGYKFDKLIYDGMRRYEELLVSGAWSYQGGMTVNDPNYITYPRWYRMNSTLTQYQDGNWYPEGHIRPSSGFYDVVKMVEDNVQKCDTIPVCFTCERPPFVGASYQWYYRIDQTALIPNYRNTYENPSYDACSGAFYEKVRDSFNYDSPNRNIGYRVNFIMDFDVGVCSAANYQEKKCGTAHFEYVNVRASKWPVKDYSNTVTNNIKLRANKQACIVIAAGIGGAVDEKRGVGLYTTHLIENQPLNDGNWSTLITYKQAIKANSTTTISSNKAMKMLPVYFIDDAGKKTDCPFVALP